jgi:putative hemolysin
MKSQYEPLDLRNALPWMEGGAKDVLRRCLDTLLSLDVVRSNFADAALAEGEAFANAVRQFGLEIQVHGPDLPASGALCVFANHPFGGADAISLGAVCSAQRPDSLLLANQLATELPGVGQRMLPLSILGGQRSISNNAGTMRRAFAHLKHGGCLLAFPSGEVARRTTGQEVKEGSWSPHLPLIALKTGATVVPAGFQGAAPDWFHALGKIHPLFRTALIPKVLSKQNGKKISLRFGQPLRLDDDKTPLELSTMLRAEALLLAV